MDVADVGGANQSGAVRVVRSRFFGALSVLIALLGISCSDGESGETGAMAVVEASPVLTQPFSKRLELVGQLSARESVVLKPEISGVVESIAFEEGEQVETGATLIVLRSAEQRATLREARAQRALATETFKRTVALSKVNVSAAAELDRARAEVEAAEAIVDLARINLERTELRAPFDGALGARWVSPGDRVDSDTSLVQIDAVDRLRLEFSLPESAVGLARVGLDLSVRVAAYPEERFDGQVYFVSPSLDPNSRRLPLKAWLSNEEGRLRPGMFARVELEIDHTDRALIVPDSAIAYDAGGSYVWRIAGDQTADRVVVELGARRDGSVRILSGISAGDMIVTSGNLKLSPGIMVEVLAPDGTVASRVEAN